MAYGGHEGGLSAKRETLRPGNSGRFLSSRPDQLWRRPGRSRGRKLSERGKLS